MSIYDEYEHAKYMAHTEKNIDSANRWFDEMVELELVLDIEREKAYEGLQEKHYKELEKQHNEQMVAERCEYLARLIKEEKDEEIRARVIKEFDILCKNEVNTQSEMNNKS